ncbi:testis-expressed protein 9 [Hetaerina americana]|uniref:testis-expressed protein 9 n=1 Tax=Hetaerina americana TaxID=62018 RepID=UPI003A7F4C3A
MPNIKTSIICIRMEVKLLKQEEEFHRYNAQLELKTNELMKEVEKVMETCEVSPRVNSSAGKGRFKSKSGYHECCEVREECDFKNVKYSNGLSGISGRSESLNSLQTYRDSDIFNTPRENVHSDLIKYSKKSSASGNIIRILNSKIKILQSEVTTLRSDYRKKVDELKKCQNSMNQLDEEKCKALSQIRSLKEENIQCLAFSNDITSKLHLRDTENASLKKEVENLKRELKSVTQGMNHNEVRMNRALEEIDRLKNALQASNLHEKELHTSARHNADHLTSVIKKLEKQKLEILHAFRKQVQLIENMKSQKEAQEASLMVKLAEKNFTELLDSVTTSNTSHHSYQVPKS